jgi:hypothetical protein
LRRAENGVPFFLVAIVATPNKNGSRSKKSRNGKSIVNSELHTELDQRHLQPVDLDSMRHQITNLVGNRALEAVNQAFEHIKVGNVQAMKYLFEMVGLFPAGTAQPAPQEDSLGRKLLNYLELSQPPSPDSEVAHIALGREGRR